MAETVRMRGHHQGEFADTITLDEDLRQRQRMAMVTDNGIAFVLNLTQEGLLREGDGIVLDDGRVIEVRAKPELLYAVRGRDAAHLLHLAWHLGHRHLPAALEPERILVRREQAVRALLNELGGQIEEIEAAFDPAGGVEVARSHLDPYGEER